MPMAILPHGNESLGSSTPPSAYLDVHAKIVRRVPPADNNMLRYYYINKEWMISTTAQRIYRIAAYLSLALFVLLIWLRATPVPENFLPLIRLCLLIAVVGAATTMVAMEYFLFGFDTSSAFKKLFWFCVMMFPPLGPALYCFFVYSRSKVLDAAPEN